MENEAYVQVFEPKAGMQYSDFSLFLPTGNHYAEYRFAFEQNPPEPGLSFSKGPNNPANQCFYRIRTAWIVRKEGNQFIPVFRAMQQGEIGLAFREQGAGDFVGGIHGDEKMLSVSLWIGDRQLPLDRPWFGEALGFRFCETSRINRCNTPSEVLAIHDQTYTLDGNTLRLSQTVRWIGDTFPLQAAYMPMLTVQRLDTENTDHVLSDTVELYAPDGTMVAAFDTSSYGTADDPSAKGRSTISACKGSYATSAKVYGMHTGFCVEGGYAILENSIPNEQISAFLCIRFMPRALDNKIYFRIWAGEGPPKGTTWRTDVFYRIIFSPGEN